MSFQNISNIMEVEIEVRLEDENVWLTQNAMAELFNTTISNISLHIYFYMQRMN